MSCRDHIRTQLPGGLEESVELDLAVAENIRVWGAAGGIFIEHIVHHPLAVFLGKVHEVERDADLAGDQFRHETVLLPFTVAVQRRVRVVPVLHKHSEHVIPLLLQQQSGDTGVNTSRKTNADFHNLLLLSLIGDYVLLNVSYVPSDCPLKITLRYPNPKFLPSGKGLAFTAGGEEASCDKGLQIYSNA